MKGSMTEQNLMKAFAGESQARNRYTFYAAVAADEGYRQIANLLLETADNERSHAFQFYGLLEGGTFQGDILTPVQEHGKHAHPFENDRDSCGVDCGIRPVVQFNGGLPCCRQDVGAGRKGNVPGTPGIRVKE